MESNFIFEGSNSKHPGLFIMQDNIKQNQIIHILTHAKVVNLNIDLLSLSESGGRFCEFILSAFETYTEVSYYLELIKLFNNMLGEYLFKLKKRGAKLTLLDYDYFNEKFNYIVENVHTRKDLMKARREFVKDFVDKIIKAVEANLKEGETYGIDINDYWPLKKED